MLFNKVVFTTLIRLYKLISISLKLNWLTNAFSDFGTKLFSHIFAAKTPKKFSIGLAGHWLDCYHMRQNCCCCFFHPGNIYSLKHSVEALYLTIKCSQCQNDI